MKITGDVYLLGDIHWQWRALLHKIERSELHHCTIICVGDIGFGFPNCDVRAAEIMNERFQHRDITFIAIRGNHDDPSYFDGKRVNLSNLKLIPDYSVLDVNGEKWLLVGGAVSIDRIDRREGTSYWKDEVFVLDESKIPEGVDVLITHSSPSWLGPADKAGIVAHYCDKEADGKLWEELKIERAQHDKLVELVKPKKLFVGHFHRRQHNTKDGVQGRILDADELILYEK